MVREIQDGLDKDMKYIVAFFVFVSTLLAQDTKNNFTVKTNLIVRDINVGNVLTPVDPSQNTNWFKIATWGDSLTYGFGSTTPADNSYPAILGDISGYTVSNGGVSSETSGQIRTRMVADTNSHVLPTIIWAGRNDVYTNSAENIIANIDAMIAALATAGNTNRWLVMNVLNGDYGSFDAPGGAGYQAITNLNAQMLVKYGTHYVPIREALVAAYNSALPNDVIDHSLDIPPESLRFDQLHLTNAGYYATARYVYTNYINVLRGEWGNVVKTATFAYPPPFGEGVPNVGYFSDLYSPFVRVGSVSGFKTFSLSGDTSSIQSNGHLIPLAHNQLDVGYNSALAWRNGYFANTVYSTNFSAYSSVTSPFASIDEFVTPLLRIGTVGANSTITRAADGSLQFGNKLIFAPDATYSIGTDTAQNRPLHGYFAGNLYADVHYGNSATITNITSSGTLTLTNSGNSARLMSDTDYRGYKYNNNGGAGYGAGATADLLTIGSYAKMMSGLLTVRTWSASSRGVYTYLLSMTGGGDAATITSTSFQQYGPTSLTGTLSIVKDTPSGGIDTVRFAVGANALTAIEIMWKPLYIDSGSSITGF
jgi:lysophospholipase L1-like esterase